jgi:uncharacterized protein (TIGR03435 family)
LIGADRRIIGYGRSIEASAEVINAVLEDRITTTPPKRTREGLRAFSQSGLVLLSAEARPMHREDDQRPDFSPSYTVHVTPAKDELGGGDYSGPDYWSLQGYTVKRLLAQMLDVNPIRIDLPASIDTHTRYDFSIVFPTPEEKDRQRNLIRQGVEDHFHIAAIRENRLRDVYVVTASDRKPSPSTSDPFAGGGYTSSMGWTFTAANLDDPDGLEPDTPHSIEAVTDIALDGATVDGFCRMLEGDLDRPVFNETNLDGRFDFHVGESPQHDFVERLRDQLGLIITPAQRSVETIAYHVR